MSSQKKRCVLAYSGGLDTSCILAWLIEKGFEVVCFIADVGQQEDDLESIKKKALLAGAKQVYLEDIRKEFVDDFVFPYLQSASLYEGRYLLGTAIARPVISKKLVEIAQREKCKFLAHGATGKGNDQVRFELSANALDPTLQVIAPWRDPEFLARFKGRKDLLEYAAEHKIAVDQTPKKPWSIDENLFHTSYESGILEDPNVTPPPDLFRVTVDPKDAPDEPDEVEIEFRAGVPVRVTNLGDGKEFTDSLDLFNYCNTLGRRHGVGRIDIVENRFVGIKSRGVYETPGGTVLFNALRDLECLVMDREVLRLRNMMSLEYGRFVYNGFWFSPEMRFLRTCMTNAQQDVHGKVKIRLFKGHLYITGRSSDVSRYDQKLSSMDEEGGYNAEDAAGFIRINGVRLKVDHALQDTIAARSTSSSSSSSSSSSASSAKVKPPSKKKQRR